MDARDGGHGFGPPPRQVRPRVKASTARTFCAPPPFNELKVPRVLDVEFTQQGRRLPPSG